MAIIYNSLKNVWSNLLKESKSNISFLPLVLLLVSIPLKLGISNVFLVIFLISVLINKNKLKLAFSFEYVMPILLFLWMALSYFWSVEPSKTINAIPKEIGLFLLPFSFFFLPLTRKQKQDAIHIYSFSIFFLALYFLARAFLRYFLTYDINVFFYHGEYDNDYGLVPKVLNAIHVSVFVAVAFFYFFTKEDNSKRNYVISAILFLFLALLSSKNIFIVVLLLIFVYLFFYSKIANKMRLRNSIILLSIIILVFSFGKIKERFYLEFQSNSGKSISHNVVTGITEGVHNVSIYEAWNNEKFTPNDFFPGTAFRVYQARLFFEFLNDEPIFWNGFGLNASFKKLEEKAKYYNVFTGNDELEGYQKKNFHNQYIQIFAELGLIGFVLLVLILFINLKNALNNKDFIHIAFAILMISLFLTESFLWRQRGMIFFALFYCLFNYKGEMLQLKSKL